MNEQELPSGYQDVYLALRSRIMDALDADTVETTSADDLQQQMRDAIDTLVEKDNIQLPVPLRAVFTRHMVNEIKGLGPLQPLMDDPNISDIMVNGPNAVYIEQSGCLTRTSITFLDDGQLQNIARRIAAFAGRRVDEANPLCDARLPDGSRVNIAIPPIALDGTSLSIRKFSSKKIGLEQLVDFGAMSPEMAKSLAIAARCRLNILISGGTGSGKTTLLNALSNHVSESERIVTIEDAAELCLQQPHVVRMETRPAGIENTGAISQRDLVINSLRMRPDRIVIGECRGSEAFEMLQAMNTGHDGSMSTLHANTPRDALARMESMVMMAVPNMPLESIRRNITSAVDLIIQVSRLHDGSRKVMSISEVMGVEGDKITLEEIFHFNITQQSGEKIQGVFTSSGLLKRSVLSTKARFFGLEELLRSAFATEATTGTDS